MTITAADIKLIESERMADTTDGGGRRTANVIADGQAGNIFPKVSRLDSVYGRVNLRKVYGAINTSNVDTYAGAHAIITDPPDNSRIGALLMSTRSDFDQRSAAQDRIESYVVAGPESRMRLYGRQPIGAKAVLAYQRNDEVPPDIGEVFALVQENAEGDTLLQQFVRIDSVSASAATFEDDRGVYSYTVLTLAITTPLLYEFSGPDTPARSSAAERLGKIRVTSVADAARYYGVQPLQVAASTGDLTIKLPTIYAALAPTTQREVPISLANVFEATSRIPTGVVFSVSVGGVGPLAPYRFPGPIAPNSVSFVNSLSGWALFDDGAGLVMGTGLIDPVGSVDYASGLVTFTTELGAAGTVAVSADHAPTATAAAYTRATEITLANRGSVFSIVLSPVPSRGTAVVDFRALGRWYRLRDESSSGTLTGGSPADGTGTIDYVSGALVVTLGALPDVASSVIFSWGSLGNFSALTTDASPRVQLQAQLSQFPLVATTCAVTLTYAGTPVTLTLDSTGAASNSNFACALNRQTGLLTVTFPGLLPDRGTSLSVAYNKLEPGGATPLAVQINRIMAASIVLGQSVQARSVSFNMGFSLTLDGAAYQAFGKVVDDGSGNLIFARTKAYIGAGASITHFANVQTVEDTIVGTINYSTGEISMSGAPAATGTVTKYNRATGYTTVPVSGAMTRIDGATVLFLVTSTGGTTSGTVTTDTFTRAQAPFLIDLTLTGALSILPGSVVFRIGAETTGVANQYSDRDGKLFLALGGAGTEVGLVDYNTGRVTFNDVYQNACTGAVSVSACMVGTAGYVTGTVDFRTAGSPVRLGSLFVQATAVDGSALSATSDTDGVLTGTDVTGLVQQDVGVVSITFAKDVLPSTVRYSAVVVSNVALDASLLGLDPIRLPLDGRVPIYRPGNVAVIHNTQAVTLTNPVVAGTTYSAGRTGLSDLWLVSAAGVRVDPAQYTVDLAAGTVTMADPLTLTGVTQPLVLKHRVEDMLLVADAQIDGTVTSAAPLSRDYATTGTYVSSALLLGDLAARVSNVFDQGTWTGEWSDSLIGGEATAQYNDVLYPLEVTNAGGISERWRLQFTGASTFQVIGENSGVIGTGSTGADCGPVNPLTGLPYFIVRASGWGSGWSVGNNLRFNTTGAAAPIWMVRTILPGATLSGDSIDVQLRGDVDA